MNPLDKTAMDTPTVAAGTVAMNSANNRNPSATGPMNSAQPSMSQTEFMIELLALMQMEQNQASLSNPSLYASSGLNSGLSSMGSLLSNPSVTSGLSPSTAQWLAMTMESALSLPGMSSGSTDSALGTQSLLGPSANVPSLADGSLLASSLGNLSGLAPTSPSTPLSGLLSGLEGTLGSSNGYGPYTEAYSGNSSANGAGSFGPVESIPAIPTAYMTVNSSTNVESQVAQAVSAASAKYNVPPSLIRGVIEQESGMNPTAVSPAGAMGLMQLMPGTAKELGVTNPFDVASNVDAGTRYLSNLLNQYNGNVNLALAAYNAGPTAVKEYGGIPPYPETQNYVSRVLSYARSFAAEAL